MSRTPLDSFEAAVIGGSAGSVPVLREMIACLPASHPLAIIVLVHLHRSGGAFLPEQLGRDARVPVIPVIDKATIEPGTVYVCPANYHTLVERTRTFALSTEPPESYARPSVDVLFESASSVYRDRLVGVILSGGGIDGARGAKALVERGGMLLCQDPSTASAPSMPEAASPHAEPSRRMTPDALAALFAEVGR